MHVVLVQLFLRAGKGTTLVFLNAIADTKFRGELLVGGVTHTGMVGNF